MEKKTPSEEGFIEHEMSCKECQELTKEDKVLQAYRTVMREDVRIILRQEWQTSVENTKRIDRIERSTVWLIASQLLQAGILIYFFIKSIV